MSTPNETHARRTLYDRRKLRAVAGLAAPVILLGALWWLTTEVWLLPARPTAETPAHAVFAYIAHPKGMMRLGTPEQEAFLRVQAERLARDEPFRTRFAAEFRVSSPDERTAFTHNLFDTLKTIIMSDVRAYHVLTPAERATFIDEHIVKYRRLSKMVETVKVDPELLGSRDELKGEMLGLLLGRTTDAERQLGAAYFQALAARVQEILADPRLTADFEARIAATQPADGAP